MQLGAFPLGQVPENDLGVIRILVLGQLGGHATEVTPGPGQWLLAHELTHVMQQFDLVAIPFLDHIALFETALVRGAAGEKLRHFEPVSDLEYQRY